jgi:hypothetical protein
MEACCVFRWLVLEYLKIIYIFAYPQFGYINPVALSPQVNYTD